MTGSHNDKSLALRHSDGTARLSGIIASTGFAAALVWLSWNNGGYDATVRYAVTIAVWWTLGLGVLLGLLPRARLTQAGVIALELLAALCAWTFASVLWAPSAELALVEFNRAAFYLGLVALILTSVRIRDLGRVADGLAIGIAIVALIALASRLYPDPFPTRGIAEFLAGTVTRLSFPLGYWNGLAALMALGVPLLLRGAVSWRSLPLRSLAVALLPTMALVIYLCSSRGGAVALSVAATVFVVLSADRWLVVAVLAVASAGSAVAIYAFYTRPELVNGPLNTDAVRDQAHLMAILVAGACVATGLLFALASWLVRGRIRIPRAMSVAAVALAVAALGIGFVTVDPHQQFEEFKALPALASDDFVNSHLVSTSGSGRWQEWSAAIDAWREAPVAGIGAGGYKAYWAQHRPAELAFVTDAHSLYLETLGELGVVGFLLLLGLFAAFVSVGCVRCVRSAGAERSVRASLLAAGLAFVVVSGIDWMWELTVVGAVGVLVLAAALVSNGETWRPGVGVRFGVVLASLVLMLSTSAPLVADLELASSRSAVERGNYSQALAHAQSAGRTTPWAAGPHLQSALVLELAGDIDQAHASIRAATERDPTDWRLWLVRARLETKSGQPISAAESLAEARMLNPNFFATSPMG